MSKGAYVGVDGKSRKIRRAYIGIDGFARKIKSGYIGVNGFAHKFFSTEVVYTTLLSTKTTRVRSSSGGTNYGSENGLLLGMTGSNNQRERVLLYFDLSAYSSPVVKATLRMYGYYNGNYEGTNPLTFGVRMMNVSWTRTGATWNNTEGNYTDEVTSGLTLPALASASDDGWKEFDITDAVNYAIEHSDTYQGFILIPNPETYDYEEAKRTRKHFRNERYNVEYTPQLVVGVEG